VTPVVIDASIAVKWFLPEVHAAPARRLLRSNRPLLAPDLLWAEVGNALWKKCRRGELESAHALQMLKDLRRFPLRIFPSVKLLDAAWELAARLDRSIYDSLYLALAVSADGVLVTADQKFYNALKGSPAGSSVTWIERVR